MEMIGDSVKSLRLKPCHPRRNIRMGDASAISYTPRRRSPEEPIPGIPGKTIGDFWIWAYSDVLENVQRAVYAEFLVACALDLADDVRIGWRSYDLRYRDQRVEVKAAAYVQSWATTRPSRISFGVGKRLEMDDVTAAFGSTPARYADAWVFALFEPDRHPAGDVVEPAFWRFYVIHRTVLEARVGDQKTASLTTISALAEPVRYAALRTEIDHVIDNAQPSH
jgi:hypothetical protein